MPITFQFHIFQMNANYVSVLYFPNECQLRISFIFSKGMSIRFQFFIFQMNANYISVLYFPITFQL